MSETLHDVLTWAEAAGESRDAVYELKKVPARLGLTDADLALIPADLRHFEAHVAPSGYAAVTRSADVAAARARGNARLRALLTRFHAARAPQPPQSPASPAVRAAWEALVALVGDAEGFPDQGAILPKGASRSLHLLRARARVAPEALDDAEIARIAADLAGEKRRTLRKAVRRLNGLHDIAGGIPGLAAALPAAPLAPPPAADPEPRLVWADLPDPLRASCEAALARAVETVADQAAEARRRIDAGEDRAVVMADFEGARTRELRNRAAAAAGYRAALAWVLKSLRNRGAALEEADDVAALLTPAAIEGAVDDHVARAAASARLKDPKTSQTVHNRLTALRTLARHGLQDATLAEDIRLLGFARAPVVNAPRKVGMTDERRHFLKMMVRTPRIAVALVNAPARIAARAEARLRKAEAAKSPRRMLSALRLHASAVLWAIQMSRPVRPGNLIKARVTAVAGALNRLVWIEPGAWAELTFPAGEVKNDRELVVSVTGEDARILWNWCRDLRGRYMGLSGIARSDYLIPGASVPRLLKDGVVLPAGTVSPSTLAEIWAAGAEVVGVAMTPHMARHAVATLILAQRPGDYASAAAVLDDAQDTVRLHYGHEEGQRAAEAARKALLAAHPDLFKRLTRKAAA